MKKKLKCFHCGIILERKENIFRNKKNHPVCENCCYEIIDLDGWDEIDNILEHITNSYNRNYAHFLKDIKYNYIICPKCNNYVEKLYFLESIKTCQSCFENNEKIPI